MNRIKQKRSFRFNIVLAIFFFISILAGFTGCGGNSEKGTKSSVNTLNEDGSSNVSGRVTLGNVEDDKAYVTGVSIKASPAKVENRKLRSLSGGTAKKDDSYYTTVDSSGRYSMSLPPGEYLVEASGSPSSKAMGRVTLAEGDAVNLDFVLTATGNIQGTVDIDSKGYDDAVIFIPGTGYLAIPDYDGSFKITNVPVGTYTLILANDDHYDDGDGISFYEVEVKPGDNFIDLFETVRVHHISGWWGSMDDNKEILLSHYELGKHGFHIDFSHPMDKEKTENAIALKINGTLLTDLDFNWGDNEHDYYNSGRKLIIEDLDEKIGGAFGTLNITIATTAESKSGKKLGKEFNKDIKIDEKIIDSRPYKDQKLVYLSRNFYDEDEEDEGDQDISIVGFFFSNSMDTASVTYEITPALGNAKVKWRDEGKSSTIWMLKGDYQLDTGYTLKITAGQTVAGRQIANLPYEISFTTSKPMVVESYPTNNAVEVPLGMPRIIFNSIMDRDSLEQGLVVKEDGNTLNDVKVKWGNYNSYKKDHHDYYNENLWPYPSHDTIELYFPASFGKKYEISIKNAKTFYGDVLDEFTLNFSTVSPHLSYSEPEEGDSWFSADDLIKLDFNTEVNWNKTNFTLLDTSVDPAEKKEFKIFFDWDDMWKPHGEMEGTSRMILIMPMGIEPGKKYRLSWTGLTAKDMADKDQAVEEDNLEFMTEKLMVDGSEPENGCVGVPPGDHRFKLFFNFPIDSEDTDKIEKAISITSKSPTDETHPDPQFIWNEDKDKLFVNFTLDFDTNYKINVNTAGDAELESIFEMNKVFIFSTETTHEMEDIFDGFQINKYDMSLAINFNACVWLTRDNFKQYFTIKDSEGNEVPLDNISLSMMHYCNWEGNKQFGKSFRLSNVPMMPGKTYTTSLNSPPEISPDEYKKYKENFPYEITGTFPEPRLFINIDNEKGMVEVNAEGQSWFAFEDIKTKFSFEPQLNGEWQLPEGENPPAYGNHFVFMYKPIKYSNIKLMINSVVPGYYYDSESKTYKSEFNFKDTPRSDVIDVDANLTPPVLEKAKADNKKMAMLYFNTVLDSEEAGKTANYSLADSGGTALTINSVVLYDAEDFDKTGELTEIEEGYTGPVAPVILLKTDEELASGTDYTITITPGTITEWGGNYPIKDGKNTADFSGYNGTITSVSGYDFNRNDSYLENLDGISFQKISLIEFDLPAEKDSVEKGVKLMVRDSFTWEYVNVDSPEMVWNKDFTALAIIHSSKEGYYYNNGMVSIIGEINNGAGFPFDTDGSYNYSSMRGMWADLSSVDNKTLTITYYPVDDNDVVDKDEAEKTENYELINIDDPGAAMPDVNSVVMDVNNSNRFQLSLSSELVSGDIVVKIKGVTDPELSDMGFSSLGSFYSDRVRF